MIWEWCFIEIPSSWTVGTTGFPSHQRLVSSWFMVPHGSLVRWWALDEMISRLIGRRSTSKKSLGCEPTAKHSATKLAGWMMATFQKTCFLTLANLHRKVFVYNPKFKLFDRIKRCLNDVPVESSTSMSSLKSFLTYSKSTNKIEKTHTCQAWSFWCYLTASS